MVQHAESLIIKVRLVLNANATLASCPLAVTCTPANGIVFSATPLQDAFISAVGNFTAGMAELSLGLCQHIMKQGTVWPDSEATEHEAGKLLQELA